MGNRYFILSYNYSSSQGGRSGQVPVITGGEFPVKSVLLQNIKARGELYSFHISEVKTISDLEQFFERAIEDEKNYPIIT